MGFPMKEVLQRFTNDSHEISQRNSGKDFWKSFVLVMFSEQFLAEWVILNDSSLFPQTLLVPNNVFVKQTFCTGFRDALITQASQTELSRK